MPRISARNVGRVQSLGVIGVPRRIDILDLEIELKRACRRDRFLGLDQLKPRVVAQFNDSKPFPLNVPFSANRLEKIDGAGKVTDGQAKCARMAAAFGSVVMMYGSSSR